MDGDVIDFAGKIIGYSADEEKEKMSNPSYQYLVTAHKVTAVSACITGITIL